MTLNCPGTATLITPPYAHAHLALLSNAGIRATSTLGDGGTHGAGSTGVQGIGVRTPSAAAVADATAGFSRLEHTPNGAMLRNGTLSLTFAMGAAPTIGRPIGSTVSVDGRAPKLHCSIAPLHTGRPTARTYDNAPGPGGTTRGQAGRAERFPRAARSGTRRPDRASDEDHFGATEGFRTRPPAWLAPEVTDLMDRTTVAGERAGERAMVERVRVWVDEPNVIFRRGLRACLEGDGFAVAGESSRFSPRPTLANVDILVFDADRGALADALDLTDGSAVRLVALVPPNREGLLYEAVDAGVAAVFPRTDVEPASLVTGLRAVAGGSLALPQRLVPGLLDRAANGSAGGLRSLVDRERSVLRLLSEGSDTREIADTLGYSERTVKNIVHDLLVKMNCRNRAHAVGHATRLGLI